MKEHPYRLLSIPCFHNFIYKQNQHLFLHYNLHSTNRKEQNNNWLTVPITLKSSFILYLMDEDPIKIYYKVFHVLIILYLQNKHLSLHYNLRTTNSKKQNNIEEHLDIILPVILCLMSEHPIKIYY